MKIRIGQLKKLIRETIEDEEMNCPDCLGHPWDDSGIDGAEEVACKTCHGTGYCTEEEITAFENNMSPQDLAQHVKNFPGRKLNMEETECPDCQGYGTTGEYDPETDMEAICDTCGGTGEATV